MEKKMVILLGAIVIVAAMISGAVVYIFSNKFGRRSFSTQEIIVKSGTEPLPPAVTPTNATILTNEVLPENKDYMPEVGNGHIATVVRSDSIFMNGLYNGANFSSHRARIPSTSGYIINATTPIGLAKNFTLDVGRALFLEMYTGSGVSITLRTYAHRQLFHVLVTELVLVRDDVNVNVDVTLDLNTGPPSEDVDFSTDAPGLLHGVTRVAEYPELAPQIDFYIMTSASLKGNIVMTPGRLSETYLAITVIDVDQKSVLTSYDAAVSAFENNNLLSSHVLEWNSLWQRGAIDVDGDINISKINYACLYYILSSLPWVPNKKEWPFVGLSPGGLAHGDKGNDYMGHVFWDQDIWMFPSIALLYPDLGRIMVETRTRTLPAAKIQATKTGYEGARYPWESAYTGLETCPASPYPEYEIHINGDVALMVQQYWQLTHDLDLMSNGSAAEIVWEIAKFWSSRVTYNPSDDTYRIPDVMPPDEYHFPVNDSVYTNSIARINLDFANNLKKTFGLPENATWSKISKKLILLYDKELDYHPEFEGFSPLDRTKQADTVLLGFPLMVQMNESTRANDLIIYEQSTPVGPAPAMTWGMFLLGWLDLNNETKAAELFTRSILNVQQPFYVWTENSDGYGAVNFQTGMGGYLQSVLFGYGGIRIHDNTLDFNPKLISGTTKMMFTGIKYRGCTIYLEYTNSSLNLTLTSVNFNSVGLEVNFKESGQWQKLKIGQKVSKNRQSFQIRSI